MDTCPGAAILKSRILLDKAKSFWFLKLKLNHTHKTWYNDYTPSYLTDSLMESDWTQIVAEADEGRLAGVLRISEDSAIEWRFYIHL